MLPLTLGSLVFGPLSGYLSDRFGARPFATGGMLVTAASFLGLILLPVDFPYWAFGALLLVSGIGAGLFMSPNMAGIMNSVPARQRGAAAGMRATFQNSGMVVSIGVFFTLMIAGLAASLPGTLYRGLLAHGVPAAVATQVAHLPPVASLFAALLGYNPMASLLPASVLHALPASQAAILTEQGVLPSADLELLRPGSGRRVRRRRGHVPRGGVGVLAPRRALRERRVDRRVARRSGGRGAEALGPSPGRRRLPGSPRVVGSPPVRP